jgi:hypothetical protein
MGLEGRPTAACQGIHAGEVVSAAEAVCSEAEGDDGM